MKHYQSSLDLCTKIKSVKMRGEAYSHIGTVYWRQGKWNDALSVYGKAHEIFEEIGDKKGCASVLHNMIAVYIEKAELDKAIGIGEND